MDGSVGSGRATGVRSGGGVKRAVKDTVGVARSPLLDTQSCAERTHTSHTSLSHTHENETLFGARFAPHTFRHRSSTSDRRTALVRVLNPTAPTHTKRTDVKIRKACASRHPKSPVHKRVLHTPRQRGRILISRQAERARARRGFRTHRRSGEPIRRSRRDDHRPIEALNREAPLLHVDLAREARTARGKEQHLRCSKRRRESRAGSKRGSVHAWHAHGMRGVRARGAFE